MTKFVVVKETPKDLPKGTYVIGQPNFLDQILENKNREPRGGLTAPTHLRHIVGSIGAKYDPELTSYTVRPHLFEGRIYKNDQELSAVILEMLGSQYPQIFDRYLAYQIKHRPEHTKLIYYVGNFQESSQFFVNGIDRLAEKDVDAYLGLKKGKGKAAEEEISILDVAGE